LYELHQSIAENYDSNTDKREWTNKFGRFRSIILSYAYGKVLEVGVGTGKNLQYYRDDKVDVRTLKFKLAIAIDSH
jgi:ubiquinone/menaquinone biosynthesis C-methylase UbiE